MHTESRMLLGCSTQVLPFHTAAFLYTSSVQLLVSYAHLTLLTKMNSKWRNAHVRDAICMFIIIQNMQLFLYTHRAFLFFLPTNAYIYIFIYLYRVSQEEWTKLPESVPYVKIYRYNPKHLYPKLNGYGDNGQRSLKLWQLLHTYWLPNTY